MRRLGRLIIFFSSALVLTVWLAFSAQAAGLIPLGSSLNWHPVNVPGTFPFMMNFGDNATTGNLLIQTSQMPTPGGGEWDIFKLRTTDGSPIALNSNASWEILFDFVLAQDVFLTSVLNQWTINGTPVSPIFPYFPHAVSTSTILGEAFSYSGFAMPVSAGPVIWLQQGFHPYSYLESIGTGVPLTADGFNFALHFVPAPIPGSFWLLGAGLVGLARLRRKFKN